MPGPEAGTYRTSIPLLIGSDVPADPEPAQAQAGTLRATGWRTEITRNGKYYIWRKGSHQNRQSARGGKFTREKYGTGYDDRRAAYERNRQRASHAGETCRPEVDTEYGTPNPEPVGD